MVDNHESHISGAFVYHAHQHLIHVVYEPPNSSHILQPLDVGPFSALARSYSKHLKAHCPAGVSKVSRALFQKVYNLARQEAFKESNIAAGWKRAGLIPWCPDRILELPEIVNYERVTPELQVPTRGVDYLATPKKVYQIHTLSDKIEECTTPRTTARVRKLTKVAVQEMARAQLLQDDVRMTRKRKLEEEQESKRKRLQVEEGKRAFSYAEVVAGRAPQFPKRFPPKQGKRAPNRVSPIED
jgi:hypothetical protein